VRSLLIPLLLLVLAIPLVVAILRANELFVLRWNGQKLRLARGQIPPRLLADLDDIVRADAPEELELRGVVEDQRTRIYPRGALTDAQKQQIRNAVGQWPVAKIRSARRR
jgi:hypothetical protein